MHNPPKFLINDKGNPLALHMASWPPELPISVRKRTNRGEGGSKNRKNREAEEKKTHRGQEREKKGEKKKDKIRDGGFRFKCVNKKRVCAW